MPLSDATLKEHLAIINFGPWDGRWDIVGFDGMGHN
jgi:hypothetical protein